MCTGGLKWNHEWTLWVILDLEQSPLMTGSRNTKAGGGGEGRRCNWYYRGITGITTSSPPAGRLHMAAAARDFFEFPKHGRVPLSPLPALGIPTFHSRVSTWPSHPSTPSLQQGLLPSKGWGCLPLLPQLTQVQGKPQGCSYPTSTVASITTYQIWENIKNYGACCLDVIWSQNPGCCFSDSL